VWFTDDCKTAIKNRKRALRNLRRHPTSDNIEVLRIASAKARKIIRQSKKHSWQSFVSKINSNTPTRQIWNMVRKIQGKNIRQPIKHLNSTTGLISNPSEIADTLASSISYNSSSSHYSSSFQKFKSQVESHDIIFPLDNNELYNIFISLQELKEAIFDTHDSTPGPDDIHYQLLKHLPTSSLEALLYLFNYYWSNDLFPSSWHKAIIIPIPKPKTTVTPLIIDPLLLQVVSAKRLNV